MTSFMDDPLSMFMLEIEVVTNKLWHFLKMRGIYIFLILQAFVRTNIIPDQSPVS